MHGPRVELSFDEPAFPGFQRQGRAAIGYAIKIVPSHGGKPRVERILDALGCEDRNGVRAKPGVERVAQDIRAPRL